jgi:hypothetical protein
MAVEHEDSSEGALARSDAGAHGSSGKVAPRGGSSSKTPMP